MKLVTFARYVAFMSRRNGKKRSNLRDVAHVAGVSVATVSRVLNAPSLVRAQTREQVEQAIAELNFIPSAAARAINSGHSRIFGALIPTLDNDIFAQTINGMEARLADFGYSLVVATTGEDPEAEARKARELLDIGVEGLFLTGVSHHPDLDKTIARFQVPAVVSSYYDPHYHLPTVGYDNFEAARLALKHLADLGHRDIAVVHGPVEHNDRTQARLAGIKAFGNGPHLSFYPTELTVEGGGAVVDLACRHRPKLDGFLCASDVQALGVLFELQRRGIPVPDKMSVVGMQDLPIAKMTSPGLTTVSLPTDQMGRRAAETLCGWINSEEPPESYCFAIELVVRGSTRKR